MAITKEINVEVKTGDSVKKVQDVNHAIQDTEQSSKDLAKTNKAAKKSFGGLTLGVKALGASLKASGIGLIIAAFAKMRELLLQNQAAVDIVNTAWNALGMVMTDVGDAILNFDETIISIGDTIKNIVLDRVQATIKGITGLGSAIMKFFEGDFVGAVATGEQALNDFFDIGDTARDLIEDTKAYGEEVLETASTFTELTNQAALAEAQLRRVFEQSDRDAEIQRRLRDDFNLTFEERLAASQRLAEILDEQEETQLRLAGLEVQRAQQALKISGDNIENQVALTNALAEQDAIQADIAGRRAEQEAQQRALEQEILTARQQEIGELISLDELRLQTKKQTLDEEVQATLDANERTRIANEQLAMANEQIAQREAAAKAAAFDATAQALTNLSTIAGNETAAGKALAIAASLINTYQGITKSLAVGGFAGIAQAVAVGAAGFLAVKNIIDTPVPNDKGSAPRGATPPQAPAFNVVGTSPINQVAETLNQDQEPVQAFVVGSNVTTQQELDRNIVETATLG